MTGNGKKARSGTRSVVIEAFPGIGGIASMTGRYIIDFFSLKPLMGLNIAKMPPVTIMKKKRPFYPVTVYGGVLPSGMKVFVIYSELPAPEGAVREVASEVMRWARSVKASVIVSPQGMIVDEEAEEDEVAVYGAASDSRGIRMLKSAGIEVFEEGYITGIPGLLLTEGMREHMNTIALMTECREKRDAAAAALIIHAVDKLCFGYGMNCEPICDAAIKLGQAHSRNREKLVERARASNSMYQ